MNWGRTVCLARAVKDQYSLIKWSGSYCFKKNMIKNIKKKVCVDPEWGENDLIAQFLDSLHVMLFFMLSAQML